MFTINPKCEDCGTAWHGPTPVHPVPGQPGRVRAKRHCPTCHEQAWSEPFDAGVDDRIGDLTQGAVLIDFEPRLAA